MKPGGKTENPLYMLALGPFRVNATEDRLRLSSGWAQMENNCPDLRHYLGVGDGNRTRTIRLGTLWRCSPTTWRFRNLRGYRWSDRERP